MVGVFIVGVGGLVCVIFFFFFKKWFVVVRIKEKSVELDIGLEEILYIMDKIMSKEDIVNVVKVQFIQFQIFIIGEMGEFVYCMLVDNS